MPYHNPSEKLNHEGKATSRKNELPSTSSQVGYATPTATRHVQLPRDLAYPRSPSLLALTSRQVEGEAQGDDEAIAAFLKDVDQGPRSAKVVKLDKEDRDVVEDEADFQVRH